MEKGHPTVFSICLPGANRKPFYARCPCKLYSFGDGNGTALAIHNAVSDHLPMTLDPRIWACSDPLTGYTLWTSELDESEEQFILAVKYKFIPATELKGRNSIHELIKAKRFEHGGAPHPKDVDLHMSVEA